MLQVTGERALVRSLSCKVMGARVAQILRGEARVEGQEGAITRAWQA
jgi:hypothetical protein